MKVKLRQIVLAIPALAKIAQSNLNIRTAYALRKSVIALQQEADFFSEERKKIVEKNSLTDKEGKAVVDPEKEKNAISELETLLDMTVTPDARVVEVALDEDIKLSVNDMELLAPFVRFKEEEGTA